MLILGAGGHGKVALEAALAAGWQVEGFLDDSRAGERTLGVPVLGKLSEFEKYRGDVDGFVLGLGDNKVRMEWLRRLELAASLLPPLIHPFSSVSKSALIAEAVLVMGGVVISAQSEIGKGAIINTSASVSHDCRIGVCAHISPGATLAGGVAIGEMAWVGAGAVVIEGRCVGAEAIVGAGAVVIDDVAPGVTVAGVPAKQLK